MLGFFTWTYEAFILQKYPTSQNLHEVTGSYGLVVSFHINLLCPSCLLYVALYMCIHLAIPK